MVLASSAAAAAPAYELPRPLALCSISANAEACACETPLVGDLLAVDAHAALLDHAQGLRRAGDQLRLLEYLRDRHLGNLARCRFTVDLDCNFRNALGHRAMLETCLEIGLGALRRRG